MSLTFSNVDAIRGFLQAAQVGLVGLTLYHIATHRSVAHALQTMHVRIGVVAWATIAVLRSLLVAYDVGMSRLARRTLFAVSALLHIAASLSPWMFSSFGWRSVGLFATLWAWGGFVLSLSRADVGRGRSVAGAVAVVRGLIALYALVLVVVRHPPWVVSGLLAACALSHLHEALTMEPSYTQMYARPPPAPMRKS